MNQTNPLGHWLHGLAEDPEVFPHQLDVFNRRLLLVRLTAARIREAAFLDQRALAGDEDGVWVPLAAALEATPRNKGPVGIILHCGHCGSTLVSRLLGELPDTWVLREPLVLQSLAAEARAAGTPFARLTPSEYAGTLALAQAAYGKLPPGVRRAVVKHTSLTANLGAELLRRSSPPAVLCLSIPLADYLAAMLRDPGLREGIRLAAGEWIHDIAAILKDDCPALGALSYGELAALNWTAAQLAFSRASEVAGARVLAWCFDDFLADPEARLAELAEHFGLETSATDISQALASPWLGRYAKDPRYPFDAVTRRRELAAAARQYANEIQRGLDFARRLRPRLLLDGTFTQPE
ncbi:MAG: hypothetical protein ACRES9_02555 [Gammaproteobacteria bacterium]